MRTAEDSRPYRGLLVDCQNASIAFDRAKAEFALKRQLGLQSVEDIVKNSHQSSPRQLTTSN